MQTGFILFTGDFMQSKSEPYISAVIYQFVVCIIIVVAVVAVKYISKDAYSEIKTYYEQNIKQTTTLQEVLDAKGIGDK